MIKESPCKRHRWKIGKGYYYVLVTTVSDSEHTVQCSIPRENDPINAKERFGVDEYCEELSLNWPGNDEALTLLRDKIMELRRK